jgi:predicted lipoprotein
VSARRKPAPVLSLDDERTRREEEKQANAEADRARKKAILGLRNSAEEIRKFAEDLEGFARHLEAGDAAFESEAVTRAFRAVMKRWNRIRHFLTATARLPGAARAWRRSAKLARTRTAPEA